MKTTLVETVNGAEIAKQVIRFSATRECSFGKYRVHSSRTVYFVKRDGRVIPCDTLVQAREEASK